MWCSQTERQAGTVGGMAVGSRSSGGLGFGGGGGASGWRGMDAYVTGVLTSAGLPASSAASGKVREAVRTIEEALRAKASIAERLAEEVIARQDDDEGERGENERLRKEVARLKKRERYLERECASITHELKSLASMVVEDSGNNTAVAGGTNGFSLDVVAAASNGAAKATKVEASFIASTTTPWDATTPTRGVVADFGGESDDDDGVDNAIVERSTDGNPLPQNETGEPATEGALVRSNSGMVQSRGARVLLSVLQESKAARGAELARTAALQQQLTDSEQAKSTAESSSASKGRQVERLRLAAETARAEVDRLTAELHREGHEAASLRGEVGVLTNQLAALVERRGKREHECVALEEEVSELRASLETATLGEQRARNLASSLEERLADSLKSCGLLRGRVSAAEGELELSREEEAACREALAASAERLRQVQLEQAEAIAAASPRRPQQGEATGDLVRREKLLEAESRSADLDAQVSRLQRQLHAAEERTAESSRAFKELSETMKTSLSHRNSTISDGEERLAAAEATVLELRREHAEELGRQRQRLLDEQAEHEMTRRKLADASETDEERLRWEKSRADAAEAMVAAERETLETTLTTVRSLEEEARTQRVRADDAEASLARTSRMLQEAGSRIASFQQRFREEGMRAKELERHLSDEKENMRKVTAELNTANSKLRESSAATERLTSREAEAQQAADRMRANCNAATAHANAAAEASAAAQRERDAVLQELNQARELARGATEERDTLLVRIAAVEKDVAHATDSCRDRERQLVDAARAQSALSERVVNLEGEREAASTRARQLGTELDALRTTLNRTEQDASVAKEAHTRSQQRLQEALLEVQELQSSSARDAKSASIATSKVEDLESQVRDLVKKLEYIENERRVEHERAVSVSEELAGARVQQEHVTDLESRLAKLQETHADVASQLSALQAERQSLMSDRDELHSLRKAHIKQESELQRLTSGFDDTRTALLKELNAARLLAESNESVIKTLREDHERTLTDTAASHRAAVEELGDEIEGLLEERNMLKEGVQPWMEKTEEYKQRWLSEMKWRRALHDELMDIKGNIRVYCRARPCVDGSGGIDDKKANKDKYWKDHGVGVLTFPHSGEVRVNEGYGTDAMIPRFLFFIFKHRHPP